MRHHLRPLACAGASSTALTLQAISSSPDTHESVSALVRKVRFVAPSISTLLLTAVRVELWIRRPVEVATNGAVCRVFMAVMFGHQSFPINVQKTRSRT